MWPSAKPRRFLGRFRAPLTASEAHRVERMLATARAFLVSCALIAVYLDPTQPSRYAALAYLLLLLYVIQSLLILFLLRIREVATPAFSLIVHGTDVLWAAVITLFTEGPSSPFFMFFVFVLLAAAYRWGLRETLLTAGAAGVIFAVEVALLTPGPWAVSSLLSSEDYDLNRMIMRAIYLLITGVLLGYLAEQEKQLRAETSTIARTMAKAQPEAGLRATLDAVLDEVLRLFETRQALLVVQETPSGRAFLWDARREGEKQPTTLQLHELDLPEREAYLFTAPAQAWHEARSHSQGDAYDLLALDGEGRRLRDVALPLPDPFLAAHNFRSLLAVSFTFGEGWRGRLFVLDPDVGRAREAEVRFLQTLVRQVMPAIYSVYLLRSLRSRAGAMERARVARELHDGVIQSLIALEVQMDVLRRRAGGTSPHLAEELAHIQQLLRQEVLNLRELMEHMTPLRLEPHQLLDFLASTVDKFGRETSIAARFVSDVPEVLLSPRVCRELVRIVQEALVNVRRHSGAHNVLVSFGSQNGKWRLVVDDNGRGFDFAGRLSSADLDGARRGPLVIKERVRAIGGELTLESIPGRGARLEITLPQTVHG